jgi:hypothetical protein
MLRDLLHIDILCKSGTLIRPSVSKYLVGFTFTSPLGPRWYTIPPSYFSRLKEYRCPMRIDRLTSKLNKTDTPD